MYKIILLTILTTFLIASNPKPYAVLGDVIYNNVDNIDKLQYISSCQIANDEIVAYTKDVNETKQYGFELESHAKDRNKKVYLEKLRELSKLNDSYLRIVKSGYKKAMKENEYKLFSNIINSGLLNLEENKLEIVDYYYKHSEDINASGVIDTFLEEDAQLKAKREALERQKRSQKEEEADKIKRIRENDRVSKERLEVELQKNLDQEQLEIRENQKKELSN